MCSKRSFARAADRTRATTQNRCDNLFNLLSENCYIMHEENDASKGLGLQIRIILNEPLYEGNIGSTARILKNFGYRDLVLVNPPHLGSEARMMAQHARDLLERASICNSLEEAVAGSDLIIGTTGTRGETAGRHIRVPAYSPKQLREKLNGRAGSVSIIFGREDSGLPNDEIATCDLLVSIPTSEEYPIMNLSHAVAVVAYELCDLAVGDLPFAGRRDLDLLYAHAEGLLHALNYPVHKRQKTALMLRRILGRAELTAREVYTLRGVLKLIGYRIQSQLQLQSEG